MHGKTVGVIGTGRIGQIFMNICKGFGMEVLAYDPYPANDPSIHYVDLHTLFRQSDILSLHCPLTEQSKHLINKDTIADMKDGVVLLNTSRGMLIESEALLSALQSGKIAAAGLDVYEEETAFFFEDFSENIHRDQVLSLLLSMPNVLLTSHQAFLTNEALKNIAEVTLQNLADFFDGKPLQNEVKTGQL
ncbi:MAG: NAD(P)-dependent oxidoreductase [Ruminococcus sp.]